MADAQIVEEETPQPVPVIAGNFPDPDAAVLDDQIESQAKPPGPAQQPTTAKEPQLVPRRPMTRLLTGSMVLQAGWDPILLLNQDPERTTLQIWCTSVTPGDYIRFSDDSGKVQSNNGSALLLAQLPANAGGISALTVPHNGPVWVSAAAAIGPVTVSYAAVTL